MTIDQILAGSKVLLDANIVVYHSTSRSPSCSNLLTRAQEGEVRIAMAASSYSEMLHQLMIAEAIRAGLITPGSPARKLSEKPDVVRSLRNYQLVESMLAGCGLEYLDLTRSIATDSYKFRQQYGLLVNDSVMAATAVANGISAVATADRAFLRVREFQTYAPDDLNRS